jgi:hypothetical protein
MHYLKSLYIFFIVLALNIFFFSTACLKANPFFINEIEVSEQLENNFNKDLLINKGFKKGFNELISRLIRSKDLNKTKNIKLNEIKAMIESFTIQEEKFSNNVYSLNLGVSFNKKKIFDYLDKKNIFPAQIITEKFFFIPIIFNQEKDELLVFSNNAIYKNWNEDKKKRLLIDYVLPTEDLEDFNLILEKSKDIENYDFNQIIEKYFLNHSIVALIFKDSVEIKVLSKITIKDKKTIKTNTFKNFNFSDEDKTRKFINELKIIYEDIWKSYNQINTSIKLPLLIQVDNKDLNLPLKFEKILNEFDLVKSYSINKFDKDHIFYEVIFNGTPKKFINIMNNKNYNFDTQKKIWILR